MVKYYRKTRRYARRSRPSDKKIRCGTTVLTEVGTTYTGYVYEAEVPQTVRGIKLDIGKSGETTPNVYGVIAYALVVVREGYDTNNLTYPALTDDMYNPTQDVLISGVITDETQEDHKYNSIGRKLRSGDRVALVLLGTGPGQQAAFELSFTALY